MKSAFGRVRAACVFVEVKSGAMGRGGFSAVLVDAAGTLLTAGHCVMRNESCTVVLPDGRRFAAEGLGAESRVDCGMIRIVDPPSDLPFVCLGRSDRLAEGDAVFSVGFPGEPQVDRGPVLRFGRVGCVRTSEGLIESSALMEPGDSGGPLFNLDGQLVGIHSQIRESLDRNQDVPVEAFLAFWDELERPENFRADRLAIEADGLDFIDSTAGCRVSSLNPDGPAHGVGLRLGDVVTQLGGREVDDAKGAQRRLRRAWRRAVWAGVDIQVVRGDEEHSFRIPSPIASRLEALKTTPSSSDAAVKSVSAPGAEVYRVTSRVDGKERAILATAVNARGWLVSKSSDVGAKIKVIGVGAEEGREGVVRFRDDRHDLCLIEVEKLTPTRWCNFEGDGDLECGTSLWSCVPGQDELLSGVVSSRLHRTVGRYLLGIRIEVDEGRVLVRRLDAKMPAAAAGLERDDELRAIDGRPLKSTGDIGAYLATFERPREVRLDILRDDQPRSIVLTPMRSSGSGGGMHIADRIGGGFSRRKGDFPLAFGHDTRLRADQCGGPLRDRRGRPLGLSIARRSRTQSLALPNVVLRGFLRRAKRSLAEQKK